MTIKKSDQSPYVFQSKKQGLNFNIESRVPWTEKQQEFLRLVQSKECKLLFLKGVAGTGKTLLAVYAGLLALKEKKVSDIVYVRSIVESATRSMGALPGDCDEKTSLYLEPLMDKLEEVIGPEHAKNILSKKLVSGRPINFLRGCQFTGKFIIADEAQNFSMPEMITFLTRIGEFSKVIVCGDPSQSDIGRSSSFTQIYNLFDGDDSQKNGIFNFEFDEEDIVRSAILKFIVKKIKEL